MQRDIKGQQTVQEHQPHESERPRHISKKSDYKENTDNYSRNIANYKQQASLSLSSQVFKKFFFP